MTVAELIEKLQKMSPDLVIATRDDEGYSDYNAYDPDLEEVEVFAGQIDHGSFYKINSFRPEDSQGYTKVRIVVL